MIAGASDFQSPDYGTYLKNDSISTYSSPPPIDKAFMKPIPFAAACPLINVTATVGCPDGQLDCTQLFRPNCELPFSAAAADLAICVIFIVSILLSSFIEKEIEEKLDEAILTAQDYSVIVENPPPHADDVNKWYKYFERFGEVQYITLLRRNGDLLDLLVKLHLATIALDSNKEGQESKPITAEQRVLLEKKCNQLKEQFDNVVKSDTFPVCKVFVTFDREKDKRACLDKLERPDIETIFNIKHPENDGDAFDGQILDVKEPAEPDNILWPNLILRNQHSTGFVAVFVTLFYLGFLACIWFFLAATRNIPSVQGILIGIIDSCLPVLFDFLATSTFPVSESLKQNRLQILLFTARFLLSRAIPYIQVPWQNFLDPAFISGVLIVQISSCFLAPILGFLNFNGIIMRFIARLFSGSQEEIQIKLMQSADWSLAAEYTGIAKVFFVSIFYCLLTPISILLAAIAFILILVVDNYLLLRKWKVSALLDAQIAARLRQQAVFSLAAHMYVSIRLIYSWPMDQVYWNGSAFEVVDKYPSSNFFVLKTTYWHSDSQKQIFAHYYGCLIFAFVIALVLLIIEPLFMYLRELFFRVIKDAGDCSEELFSSLAEPEIYYPSSKASGKPYLIVKEIAVPKNFRPIVFGSSNEQYDLSIYVPADKRDKVLSTVQCFSAQIGDAGEENHASKKAHGLGASSKKNKPKKLTWWQQLLVNTGAMSSDAHKPSARQVLPAVNEEPDLEEAAFAADSHQPLVAIAASSSVAAQHQAPPAAGGVEDGKTSAE